MYTNPSKLSPEVRALLDRLPIELLERIKMHQSPKSQKKFRSRFKQAAS
jgi:hypothetical protein